MTKTTHLGEAAWLKEGELARLLALLDCDGEEARVVGGAVRNALLGLAVGEIDVATTAVPDEVVRRVAACRLEIGSDGHRARHRHRRHRRQAV